MNKTYSPDLPNVLIPGPLLEALDEGDKGISMLAECATLKGLRDMLRAVQTADLALCLQITSTQRMAAAAAIRSRPEIAQRRAAEQAASNAYVEAMRGTDLAPVA